MSILQTCPTICGHTTPDCQYLLRLMNVLDIREPKEITKTTNF